MEPPAAQSTAVSCPARYEAKSVDATAEPDRIADLVGSADDRPELRTVVTTHRHADHWQALGVVAGMFETRQIADPLDAPEQRAARRAGFEVEGLLRSHQAIGGTRGDLLLHSLIRPD